MNTLYYGDNLKILREYIKDESVDLVYLDPPFNSNRNYNVLFRNESGAEAESQITAFEDTWHWGPDAEETFHDLINQPDQVGRMIESFRQFIGTNQMMAYLVMMAVRLKELHRILKPTGSLYLHCDPTASHYLKILLDTVFGVRGYRNEINWKRTSAHSDAKHRFPNVTDSILFYAKSEKSLFKPQFGQHDETYLKKFYRYDDNDGRGPYRQDNITSPNPRPNLMYEWLGFPYPAKGWRYSKETMQKLHEDRRICYPVKADGSLDTSKRPSVKRYLSEGKGSIITDTWIDIHPLQFAGNELLGYPTQKPVALLERIISASSNEGDIVLDPFCGCGTTIAAAQKLNREWIGIDVTHLAVGLIKLRLRDLFGMVPIGKKEAAIAGSPKGIEKIAQGKAEGRDPGNPTREDVDPEGVEHTAKTDVAPLQGAGAGADVSPGFHPGLLSSSPSATGGTYRVIGQPEDLEGAKKLAADDKYGFQWWILPLIGAKAYGSEAGKKEGKKGADRGIDGELVFTDDNSGKAKRVIVSVKGGGVNVAQIRDLAHVVDREKAAIGVFLTLEPPTKPMTQEAVGEGFYHSPGWNKDYPKLQIITVEEILAGKSVNLPPNIQTFKKAGKVAADSKDQGHFGFE